MEESMIRKRWKLIMTTVNNEDGFTMILALILLLLLTIIGVAAINTSTTGTMITSAEEVKRAASYVAESAVEQATGATAILRTQFMDINQKKIWSAMASGGTIPQPRWDFALNGSDMIGNGHNHDVLATEAGVRPASGSKWKQRFDAGVLWDNGHIANDAINSYEVRVWNNSDSPPPSEGESDQIDNDGMIVVGAIAGPLNTVTKRPNIRSVVEIVMGGANGPGPAIGGPNQAGGGPLKTNSNTADVGAVSLDTAPTISTTLSSKL